MLYESVSSLAHANAAVFPLGEEIIKLAQPFPLFSINLSEFAGCERFSRVKAVAGGAAVVLC